jgi:acyl dehydratase
MVVNYGLNKVRFTGVVLVDSRTRLQGKIESVEDYAHNGVKIAIETKIELEGVLKPVCIAEWLILIFE